MYILLRTEGNLVLSLSDETSKNKCVYIYTYLYIYIYISRKPRLFQTINRKNWTFSTVSVGMFPFVIKKGPYILMWPCNELNPIHGAQTPNRDIAASRKAFRVSVHAIHSPGLCKVVSTVMVLYCDWSSGVTAGKSMGFFEKWSCCRCAHVSVLAFGMHPPYHE